MRSPHVPLINDGTDDRALKHEQMAFLYRGYSAEAQTGRLLVLHRLEAECRHILQTVGHVNPDKILRLEERMRRELEAM